MAVTVVFSTLMVLLAKQHQSFNTLWSTPGAVNDPTGDKHTQPLQGVIINGNFKSNIVDNWEVEGFDCVSVYGMNMFGDELWETEFNITNRPSSLTSWLLSEQIISSMAEISGAQDIIQNMDNYEIRFSPSSGKSWFAVSASNLSYGPLPFFFVPRSPSIPFDEPVFLDGPLGCWETIGLINYDLNFTDATSMTPTLCIEKCGHTGKSLAVLVEGRMCYCADINPSAPPTDATTNCFRTCTGSSDLCGGFNGNYGNAYHVQGSTLPGELQLISFYTDTLVNVNSKLQISSSDVYGMPSRYMFISQVNLTTTGSTNPKYTIHYSELNCSASAGMMKVVSYDGVNDMEFHGSGIFAIVDILRVQCIELVLNAPVLLATVELWGPDDSFDHVAASILVVRGKKYIQVTTTTSTTTDPPTTSTTTVASTTTPTTQSSTSTSTTYSPTTTTAAPSTTSTTQSPTTTTTVAPTTTSTTASPTTTSTQATTPSTPFDATTTTTTSQPSTTSTSATTSTHPSTTTTSTSSSITTATGSSSSSTIDSTYTQTTESPKCSCPCNTSLTQFNLTTEQLQEKILEIQRRLAVNVSKLSSTIRKLTSAEDSRVSAVSIGYVGVGILISIFASIVFIDSARLLRDLKKLFLNIRDGLCPKMDNNNPIS